EQRQQRQTENREIIAFDPRHELGAKAFELITADALQHPIAHCMQIEIEKGVAKAAQDDARALHMAPQHMLVSQHRGGGHQFMLAPAKRPELRACLLEARRLVQPCRGAFEHLVGAEDERAGMPRCHRARLRFRQRERAILGGGAGGTLRRLDAPFIDRGGIDHRPNAAGVQQPRPRGAGRGEHESAHASSVPSFRARSFKIAAAVSSIERRLTSITGQLWSVKSRRAWVTSSRTLTRSVYSLRSSRWSEARRWVRTWISRSGSLVSPTMSGRVSSKSSGGRSTPGTTGTLAALMPRLAR